MMVTLTVHVTMMGKRLVEMMVTLTVHGTMMGKMLVGKILMVHTTLMEMMSRKEVQTDDVFHNSGRHNQEVSH